MLSRNPFAENSAAKPNRGASLIEAMAALAILGSAAIGIYPVVYQSKKIVKHSDFHDQCINAVRGKLNEYKFGANATQNGLLSSDTAGDTAGASTGTSTGFIYAKTRYNQDALYCPFASSTPRGPSNNTFLTRPPVNVIALPPAVRGNLGRRECVRGIGVGAGTEALDCSGSAEDVQMRQSMPGFRVYVNLRRYNSLFGTEDCAMYQGVNAYDFRSAGDMIKITVTGFIDLTTVPSFDEITAGSPREPMLTCQVSDYLKPFPMTARYWMQTNGEMYRWTGTGNTAAVDATGFPVLTALNSAANRGFVVSPDNRYVYVLRPGVLQRYDDCGGEPLNCDPTTTAPIQWSVDPNIVSISAKWLPDAAGVAGNEHDPVPVCDRPIPGQPVIFGLLADRRTAVCLEVPSNAGAVAPAAPTPLTSRADGWVRGDGVTSRIPFQIPQNNRVHSIFMDPMGNNAFVVDLTMQAVYNNTYSGGIYETNDRELQYPLEVFNVRGVAFSK